MGSSYPLAIEGIMAAAVVSAKREGSKAIVVLGGDTFMDVGDTSAKKTAIDAAHALIGLCGISNTSGPYPVDDQDREIKDFEEMAKAAKEGRPLKYRNEFTLAQSM